MNSRLSIAALETLARLLAPRRGRVRLPASAMATTASTPELVQGTTAGSLAIAAGTGALMTTNFSPGNTASQVGALTATDTSPSWTLSAKDGGTGAGKMVASSGTCTVLPDV